MTCKLEIESKFESTILGNTPDININIVVDGKPVDVSVSPGPPKSVLPGMTPPNFDPKTILQAIRGLLTLHEVFVESGVLPKEDIENLLFPNKSKPPKIKPRPPMKPNKVTYTTTPKVDIPATTTATPTTFEPSMKRLIRTLRKYH